jgi:hypothetical protein
MLALVLAPLLWGMGLENSENLSQPTIGTPALAIVGAPVTPVSVAGVARRTTRRTVAYSSAASASAAAEASAAQAQTAASAAPQPAVAALPAGTTVSALPQDCTSMQIDGGSYFNCAGVIYKPTFQSNNLVYVVQ